MIISVDLLLGDGWCSGVDTPILRIQLPKNGFEVEPVCNDANTVIKVTIRWAPALWGDAGDEFDRLHGVVKLSKSLFVGQGGHWGGNER